MRQCDSVGNPVAPGLVFLHLRQPHLFRFQGRYCLLQDAPGETIVKMKTPRLQAQLNGTAPFIDAVPDIYRFPGG